MVAAPAATTPPLIRTDAPRTTTLTVVMIGALVLTALTLRVALASGDFWLDELFTLDFMARWVETPVDVFWRFVHDNNHPINTLWLLLLGPDPSPLAARALSVLAGGGAVCLAWFWGRDHGGNLAGALAAFLVATSFLLVHYGSEARGYGPLILFALAFLRAAQRHYQAPDRRKAWMVGITAFLGLLSHLTMVFVLAAAGLWIAWTSVVTERAVRPAWARIGRWDRAPLLGAMAAAALLVPGILHQGGMAVGALTPFDLNAFTTAYDQVFRLSLGLTAIPPGSGFVIALLTAAAAFGLGITPDARRLCLVLMILPGAVALLLRLPNTEFPRYFLPASLGFLLLLALVLAAVIQSNGLRRAFALVAISLILLMNLSAVHAGWQQGRDRHGQAIAHMAATGPLPLRLGSAAPRVRLIAQWQARHQGIDLQYISDPGTWCGNTAPDWLVLDDARQRSGDEIIVGSGACAVRFVLTDEFAATGPSSLTWWVYRRQ